jgi:penicillin-binding protein 1A
MTQRARKRQRGRPKGSAGRKILLALGVLVLIIAIGIGAAAGWALSIYDSAPSIDSLTRLKKGQSSAIYAADGRRLGFIHADTVRQPVPQSDLPLVFKQATVSIEDRNFYTHGGIDPSAIIRAAVQDILAGGKPVQGGSTITQQLVRNLYRTEQNDTIERKIIEAHLANDLEDVHDKDWILAKYLNTAPYGTNNGSTAFGVQAAAETYFSKPAKDLTLTEAALIAGLPQDPNTYNPFNNPDAAKQRRNEVLAAMEDQGYITPGEYTDAIHADLGLHASGKYSRVRQPLIFDLVQQELLDKYGPKTVQYGGLKVYTTIQPSLQAAAQRSVDACAVCYAGGGPQAALASVDPSTGAIVALASSSTYSNENQFNLAAQAHRQPGSSFKTYVLTTAVKQGVDPDTTYYDGSSPKTLLDNGGIPWEVHNAGDGEGGPSTSLRIATVDSINVVYAQLGLDVGPENFADMAYQMGITSPLGVKTDANGAQVPCKEGPDCFIPPADAIGGLHEGITPLEQADGYATLASGGVHHDATAIGRVVFPDGKVDTPEQSEGNRVLTPGEAYTVTNVLEGVITGGTGGNANIGCYNGMAGKTGTTEGESDGWFVGYTPKYSTAVWVGHPNSREFTGFGGDVAAPIWNSYMSVANGTCQTFDVPTNLPSLSSFFSDRTDSAPHISTTPTTTTPTKPDKNPGGTGGGNFDPNLYQGGDNGIQGPPDTGGNPGGGGNGGGPPTGGGTGGGGNGGGGGGIGPG